jgi:high-affinity iron transporter
VRRALPIVLLLALAGVLQAGDDPRGNARALVPLADSVVAALDSSSHAAALERWGAFTDRWLAIEDPIRALSPGLYRAIEERMQDVTGALPRKGEWRTEDARSALHDMGRLCLEVASLPAAAPAAAGAALTIDEFARTVASARETARTDAPGGFERANSAWFQVEQRVAAADHGAYTRCEATLAQARSALKAGKTDELCASLERLHETVLPLASERHVGVFSTAAIILREGAEALVVLAAIAAFLGRLGAPEKARAIWLGGALGLAASLLGGGLLIRFFTGVAAGENREVVEGVSSLVAAALLVLVGHWLHEKIRRGGWKTKVQTAVESGRTLSLVLLAFFAVFREGAETVVFLGGLAPASTPREMLLGVAAGLALLAVLGALLLGLGRKVPIGSFLAFASLLLWALAVRFVGCGVQDLQAGGVVSATPFPLLPSVPLLGFAPTFESAGAQLAALLAWAGFVLLPRLDRTRWRPRKELSSIEA